MKALIPSNSKFDNIKNFYCCCLGGCWCWYFKGDDSAKEFTHFCRALVYIPLLLYMEEQGKWKLFYINFSHAEKLKCLLKNCLILLSSFFCLCKEALAKYTENFLKERSVLVSRDWKRGCLWRSWNWKFQEDLLTGEGSSLCISSGRWREVPELLEGLLNNWTTKLGKLRIGAEKNHPQIPSESLELSSLACLSLIAL